MDTEELMAVGRCILPAKSFLGVFALDEIPKRLPPPCGIIVNSQTSNLAGLHWIAVLVSTETSCHIYDSLGGPPATNLTSAIHARLPSVKISFNTSRDQHPLANTCGMFALNYLYKRL